MKNPLIAETREELLIACRDRKVYVQAGYWGYNTSTIPTTLEFIEDLWSDYAHEVNEDPETERVIAYERGDATITVYPTEKWIVEECRIKHRNPTPAQLDELYLSGHAPR